jgi:hypothetical protein
MLAQPTSPLELAAMTINETMIFFMALTPSTLQFFNLSAGYETGSAGFEALARGSSSNRLASSFEYRQATGDGNVPWHS